MATWSFKQTLSTSSKMIYFGLCNVETFLHLQDTFYLFMMFYYGKKSIFILLKLGLDGEAVVKTESQPWHERAMLIKGRINFKKVARLLKSDRSGLKTQIPECYLKAV